jgi:hypothetical protein
VATPKNSKRKILLGTAHDPLIAARVSMKRERGNDIINANKMLFVKMPGFFTVRYATGNPKNIRTETNKSVRATIVTIVAKIGRIITKTASSIFNPIVSPVYQKLIPFKR